MNEAVLKRVLPETAITTREQVAEVYRANRTLTHLSSAWLDSMKAGDKVEAARLRRTINQIKRAVLDSYGIVLD